MKTKKKAVKRKLAYGLSMECGKEDVSKKHCPISSNVPWDGNTSNIRNNFLQVSDKGNKFGCHTDLVPHTLSYTDEYDAGQKVRHSATVAIPMEKFRGSKRKISYFEVEYESQGTSSNSNCEGRHSLSQKLKDIYNWSTKLREQKHTCQAKSVPDTDTFKQHTYQILQPKDARRYNARFSQLNELNQDSVNQQHLNEKSVPTANKIPLEYSSLGKCICVCRYCRAKLWECEKVSSTSNSKNFAYNKCCYGGRTVLHPTPEYPQYIKELYKDKHFMENIRAYNQMFSMTSLGANVDSSVNKGKGPYVFRVSGLIYHWIGSMQPDKGQAPRFLQLYIHDTTNEVNNRMANFGDEHESILKKEIVEGLIQLLDSHNAFVQLFRTARNKYMEADIPEFKVRLYNVIGTRQYELPTAETIGAIVFAETSGTENDFDLIIEEHSRFPQRVNKLHPCYMSLQFSLLFIYDRADIVDRVFEKKVRDYIAFVRDSNTFGNVTAVLYTIEFQKRGLPYCHSLLWIEMTSKVKEAIDVDIYVSAELPDPKVDAIGHRVISELMIHVPCGYANRNASCMKDESRCNRNFPKSYCDKTYIDKDGFVHYRRRDTGIQTQRQSVSLDNQYVVPYNRTLCMRYYAHINVEYCGWTMLIKYLFKYISKGTDRVIANITGPTATVESTTNVPAIQVDEVKNYVEARYIGPHEACWRILDFPIHYRNPYVQALAVHLENMQQITFKSKDNLESIVNNPVKKNDADRMTNKAACEALGLIGGDEEWTMALQEAADFATASELRRLFFHILIFCNVSIPINLWQKSWENLCDDVPHKLSKSLRISQIERDAKKMQASILFDIQLMLNLYSKSLEDFGLPTPPQDMFPILQNRLLMEETNYNLEAITIALRSEEKIVLVVASSGITSLLLPSDRTAHSWFQLPLTLKDESTCHIKKNSQLADLLRRTNLIIWDEAPMNDRRCFKALDHCLRDILDSPHTLFGGCSIMLGGDFRQTLPVKKKASKPEIIDASITSSYLWEGFKIYTLTHNMRLYQSDLTEAQKQCLYQFSTWLLDIGNGNIGTPDESETKDIFNVHIPIQLYLQKKAIVAPTNESADMINAHVLSLVNHQQRIYLSSDEAIPHGNDGGETELLYPAEYLNSLNFSGFPPHMLQLKVGSPIILLCNLNIATGLCNRTRLIVTQLLDKVIEARIITGTRTSKKVFLPRIPLINRDLQLPFIFKRKQFPVKLCYAMTINKSQGQSLQRIGIFLPEPVFTHGQFKMTEPSNPAPNQIDKGKLPLVEVTTVSIADIKPAQVDQAIETKTWDHTLPNDITLIFGRYISFGPIPNNNFPKHYFNFIAYNEVDARADVSEAPLTAESFDINAYEKMPKPVIIAVSSTWATKRYGALQINATSATCYYLNPEIPETSHILNVYADFINPVPELEIERQPYSTQSEEQMRNRHTLQSLLNVNPQHYEQIKFTTKATLLQIIAPNGWYYRKCSQCNIKIPEDSAFSQCQNHGPQPTPHYGYCFRAIIDDGTATTTITCFSPDAHTFVPDYNSVVNSVEDKDTYHMPSILSQAEGHRYIFQYHFEPESTNSPAAKILEGSSTTTDPPSTTEGHLPTATAKDNATEAAKDLEKKESQCNVKVESRPRALHEVPLLTLTANRVIEMDDPVTATDSSSLPPTIERSPLDFSLEAGASDQGTAASEVPPSGDVQAAAAPEPSQVGVAATDPPAATESRKRGHDGTDANAPPPSHCERIMLIIGPQGALMEERASLPYSWAWHLPLPCLKMHLQASVTWIHYVLLILRPALWPMWPSPPQVLLPRETRSPRMLLPPLRSGRREHVASLKEQVSGEEKVKASFEEFKRYEDDRVERRCAEAKFVAALQALKDLKYPLLDQLEGLKDAPIDVIMAALILGRMPRNVYVTSALAPLSSPSPYIRSRAEKKKKYRIVCRTHGVGSTHHARSDGVPVSAPTVVPQGLVLLLADAATQTQ
nr:DNA helicase [Tanacetum cinerariifolium]